MLRLILTVCLFERSDLIVVLPLHGDHIQKFGLHTLTSGSLRTFKQTNYGIKRFDEIAHRSFFEIAPSNFL